MGVVVSFEEKKRGRPLTDSLANANDGERVVAAAMHAATNQLDVMKAARPLLDRCRDRYGFVVMRDGLPQEPDVLVRALLNLSRGLAVLDLEMEIPRTYPTFGVYFGRRRLGWFEDGYSGTTGLAVPNDTEALALASFVRSRICVAQARSQE